MCETVHQLITLSNTQDQQLGFSPENGLRTCKPLYFILFDHGQRIWHESANADEEAETKTL